MPHEYIRRIPVRRTFACGAAPDAGTPTPPATPRTTDAPTRSPAPTTAVPHEDVAVCRHHCRHRQDPPTCSSAGRRAGGRRSELVPGALSNALAARNPGTSELIIHHDRGSQYTSNEYRDRLFAAAVIPSVGHTGICYDNAAAESFNASTKKELIHQHVWHDADEVRTAIFDYIERYYNRVRKQRRLGRMSPASYETAFDNREVCTA